MRINQLFELRNMQDLDPKNQPPMDMGGEDPDAPADKYGVQTNQAKQALGHTSGGTTNIGGVDIPDAAWAAGLGPAAGIKNLGPGVKSQAAPLKTIGQTVNVGTQTPTSLSGVSSNTPGTLRVGTLDKPPVANPASSVTTAPVKSPNFSNQLTGGNNTQNNKSASFNNQLAGGNSTSNIAPAKIPAVTTQPNLRPTMANDPRLNTQAQTSNSPSREVNGKPVLSPQQHKDVVDFEKQVKAHQASNQTRANDQIKTSTEKQIADYRANRSPEWDPKTDPVFNATASGNPPKSALTPAVNPNKVPASQNVTNKSKTDTGNPISNAYDSAKAAVLNPAGRVANQLRLDTGAATVINKAPKIPGGSAVGVPLGVAGGIAGSAAIQNFKQGDNSTNTTAAAPPTDNKTAAAYPSGAFAPTPAAPDAKQDRAAKMRDALSKGWDDPNTLPPDDWAPMGSPKPINKDTGLPEPQKSPKVSGDATTNPGASDNNEKEVSVAQTQTRPERNINTSQGGPYKPVDSVSSKSANSQYQGTAGSQAIKAANPDITNVNFIKAGKTINVPGVGPYEVKPGDTLDKIAKQNSLEETGLSRILQLSGLGK
jgi:hypothetical protein